MTWIKLDDNAVDHPKVASLTDRAFRWWVKGLSYASRFLTDGILPPIFWKQTPKQTRAELSDQHLWDWDDPNFKIHDYLHHQTRKEDVEYEKERNRIKAAAYRNRKRFEKLVTGNVTGDASPKSDRAVPNPENREQRTDPENREQMQKRQTAAPLITSLAAYERRKAQCAFVGSRLEVPHSLHAELRKTLGGTDPEAVLQAWYLTMNDEIDVSGEAIAPDIFKWLKPRFAGFVNGMVTDLREQKRQAGSAYIQSIMREREK